MIQFGKKIIQTTTLATITMTLGCAGLNTSKFAFDDSYQVNTPKKGESCYDASVLLGTELIKAKEIATKVIIAVDSKITSETNDSISAERNRHIGVFVGSGGEELGVKLKEIGKERTFVTVTTKTGFVGGAGQKAWSCQIVDEMVKMAAK